MTEEDFAFLENQRGDRTFYCSSFSCRQWEPTLKRREALEKSRERARAEMQVLEATVSLGQDDDDDDEVIGLAELDGDEDFDPTEKEEEIEPPSKRHCRYVASSAVEEDSFPEKYRHVRHSLRNVRDELFFCYETLVFKGHLNMNQADCHSDCGKHYVRPQVEVA